MEEYIGAKSGKNDMTTTIVIAEDDCIIRMLVVDLLLDAGFKVIEALHAKDALDILEVQFQDIHMLFTDIHMPGQMNGLALAHHVKNHWPKIALLVTSGGHWPRRTDLPEGSRFLLKPYNFRQLINHIQNLIAT